MSEDKAKYWQEEYLGKFDQDRVIEIIESRNSHLSSVHVWYEHFHEGGIYNSPEDLDYHNRMIIFEWESTSIRYLITLVKDMLDFDVYSKDQTYIDPLGEPRPICLYQDSCYLTHHINVNDFVERASTFIKFMNLYVECLKI